MDLWVVWLLVAGALGLGEMHKGGFYLRPFGLGAGAATVLGLLGAGTLLSVLVFLLASGVVFGTLRPIARRHRRLPPSIRTGAAAPIGRPAVVAGRSGHAG